MAKRREHSRQESKKQKGGGGGADQTKALYTENGWSAEAENGAPRRAAGVTETRGPADPEIEAWATGALADAPHEKPEANSGDGESVESGLSQVPDSESAPLDLYACPACGAKTFRSLCEGSDKLYATTDRKFLVVECDDCNMVRLYPWPDPEELATYYPDNYWFDPTAITADRWADKWRKFVTQDHVKFVRGALEAAGRQDLPMLDVGCGGGLFLREMGLPSGRAIGLDFSPNAASVAWNTNGVPAVCGALPRAPFSPGSFAVITMFHVLEHLYDPIAYLEAAHKLLDADGRLVVQVPNAASWQFLLLGESWNGIDIPRHLINFKEQDLKNLLDHCGFDVVRTKHFSLRDNPAGFATSIATALDPMSRRVRRVPESPMVRLLKDLVYGAITVAAIPFAALEAACGAGSTIMLEARPRPHSA